MSAFKSVKTYFKEEGKWEMLGLEHPKPPDFYLCAYQKSRSSVPLLIFRIFLFLGTLAIVLSSKILYILAGIYQYWFIYLTHWGLMSILCATGFSAAVSARVHFKGPISVEFCLPWYVKTSWVLYNIANPLAYLITIFYWTVLFEAGVEEELNFGLDIAVHGLNTIIMLMVLFSSSQPSRIFHAHHPLLFGLAWLIFSLIFYAAGGTDSKGQPYVYPVINWARPGPTIGWVVAVAVLIIALHLFTIGLAAIRDVIARRWFKPEVIHHVEEGTPLRQTQISQYAR